MTVAEYNAIKNSLEVRYKEGMASLETLWFALNGTQPPDSVVSVERREEVIPGGDGLRSALSIGAQPATRIEAMHRERSNGKGSVNPKRSAAMKAAWERRRAKNK